MYSRNLRDGEKNEYDLFGDISEKRHLIQGNSSVNLRQRGREAKNKSQSMEFPRNWI